MKYGMVEAPLVGLSLFYLCLNGSVMLYVTIQYLNHLRLDRDKFWIGVGSFTVHWIWVILMIELRTAKDDDYFTDWSNLGHLLTPVHGDVSGDYDGAFFNFAMVASGCLLPAGLLIFASVARWMEERGHIYELFYDAGFCSGLVCFSLFLGLVFWYANSLYFLAVGLALLLLIGWNAVLYFRWVSRNFWLSPSSFFILCLETFSVFVIGGYLYMFVDDYWFTGFTLLMSCIIIPSFVKAVGTVIAFQLDDAKEMVYGESLFPIYGLSKGVLHPAHQGTVAAIIGFGCVIYWGVFTCIWIDSRTVFLNSFGVLGLGIFVMHHKFSTERAFSAAITDLGGGAAATAVLEEAFAQGDQYYEAEEEDSVRRSQGHTKHLDQDADTKSELIRCETGEVVAHIVTQVQPARGRRMIGFGCLPMQHMEDATYATFGEEYEGEEEEDHNKRTWSFGIQESEHKGDRPSPQTLVEHQGMFDTNEVSLVHEYLAAAEFGGMPGHDVPRDRTDFWKRAVESYKADMSYKHGAWGHWEKGGGEKQLTDMAIKLGLSKDPNLGTGDWIRFRYADGLVDKKFELDSKFLAHFYGHVIISAKKLKRQRMRALERWFRDRDVAYLVREILEDLLIPTKLRPTSIPVQVLRRRHVNPEDPSYTIPVLYDQASGACAEDAAEQLAAMVPEERAAALSLFPMDARAAMLAAMSTQEREETEAVDEAFQTQIKVLEAKSGEMDRAFGSQLRLSYYQKVEEILAEANSVHEPTRYMQELEMGEEQGKAEQRKKATQRKSLEEARDEALSIQRKAYRQLHDELVEASELVQSEEEAVNASILSALGFGQEGCGRGGDIPQIDTGHTGPYPAQLLAVDVRQERMEAAHQAATGELRTRWYAAKAAGEASFCDVHPMREKYKDAGKSLEECYEDHVASPEEESLSLLKAAKVAKDEVKRQLSVVEEVYREASLAATTLRLELDALDDASAEGVYKTVSRAISLAMLSERHQLRALLGEGRHSDVKAHTPAMLELQTAMEAASSQGATDTEIETARRLRDKLSNACLWLVPRERHFIPTLGATVHTVEPGQRFGPKEQGLARFYSDNEADNDPAMAKLEGQLNSRHGGAEQNILEQIRQGYGLNVFGKFEDPEFVAENRRSVYSAAGAGTEESGGAFDLADRWQRLSDIYGYHSASPCSAYSLIK